jgi:4'-phosphopantetheinyl transferase
MPLPHDQVHVWRVSLLRSQAATVALRAVLSPEETERAGLQAGERLQRRFVVAHAETRRILAGYLGEDPGALLFAVHPQGKPRLSGVGRELRFNLAHSGELAVLAVSSDREVGIDVEWVDPRRDLGALLPAFAPDERAELERIAEGERRAALFAAWTRKEAILKATGRGIGWGLAASDRAPGGCAEDRAPWTLVDIDCGEDYRGTLAAEGSGWEVRVFDSAEP